MLDADFTSVLMSGERGVKYGGLRMESTTRGRLCNPLLSYMETGWASVYIDEIAAIMVVSSSWRHST